MSTPPVMLTERDSPITPETVSLGGVSLGDLRGDGVGGLCFACADPARRGSAVVQWLSGPTSLAAGPETLTDLSYNVRSAVHEYGGGSFGVCPEGFVYTDFPTKAVYWQETSTASSPVGTGQPLRIYPASDASVPDPCRFADFSILRPTRTGAAPVVLAVMEDHSDPSPAQVKNSIVTLSLDGSAQVVSLARGMDFYASPTVEHKALAYIAWNHPNMPWDETSLYLQELDDSGASTGMEPMLVHGGTDISVYAPQWHGSKLYFLSNATGWYNLYEYSPATGATRALYPKEADFSEGACGWILGVRCFALLESGLLVARYSCKTPESDTSSSAPGGSRIVLVDLDTYSAREVDLPTGPSSISSLTASGNALYCLGGSTKTPIGIWYWEQPGDSSSPATEVYSSLRVENLSEIQSFFSEPQFLKFSSVKASNAGVDYSYGYYYPPNNLSSALPQDFRPPLLVKAHGGPTACTSTTFVLKIQFWTSRGFAVLDVDYGGSTGYGREFLRTLRGQWGVVDVVDVCSGARYCAEHGLANPEWLCIDGGSAGGYTTLAALAFESVFKAGASLYGVGDLSALAEETHKFESRYLDGLIAPYPNPLYDERCPIKHVDKFDCPVILLQGDEDKIVPPGQAETMFQVLSSKGLITALVMYKGEQHGFRKAENIKHALLSEYVFFCEIFGILPQSIGDFSGLSIGKRVEV